MVANAQTQPRAASATSGRTPYKTHSTGETGQVLGFLENLIPLAPRARPLDRASRRRATSRYLLTGSAPCGNRRWRATPRLRRRHISRWPLVLYAESYPPVSRPRRSALVA